MFFLSKECGTDSLLLLLLLQKASPAATEGLALDWLPCDCVCISKHIQHTIIISTLLLPFTLVLSH